MAGIPQPLVSPINLYTGTGGPPPPPPPPSGTSGGLTSDYGLFDIPVSNAAGHGLVAYIGWNTETFPKSPVASVADDAHNQWIPLVTTAAGFNARCAIWIAPNAQPATFVSIATSLPTTGIAALVAEIPSLPALAQAGITAQAASSNGAGSLSVSTSASSPIWGFAVAVTTDNQFAVTAPGSPWTALGTVKVNDPGGAGGVADVAITPMYGQFNAGTVSASFSWTPTSLPIAVGMAGILQAPSAVVYKNPNWPALKIEAAFGYSPGDPTSMPSWTDITSRAQTDQNEQTIQATRGRDYELTQPSAGSATIWCDNHDGALSPLNSGSPYSPNVLLEVPVRVSATWNNRTYPVTYGRVDKWPQQWPEPQWGMSPMEMSDAMGILANLAMFSAYQSEVLLDNPYAYWPCGESYGDADGLPFQNLATGNSKPLLGIDGHFTPVTPLSTGQTLNMLGDTGTGIGMSGLTSPSEALSAGAICLDPGLPQIGPTGFTVEYWAIVDPGTTGGTPLVTLAGNPSNYPVNAGPIRLLTGVVNSSGFHTQVLLGDFAGDFQQDLGSTMPTDGLVHHHVFTVTTTGGPGITVAHYLDGSFDHSFTSTTVSATTDIYQVLVGPVIPFPLNVDPYNYAIGHIAIYSGTLAAQRISAHYQAGTGYNNDTVFQRFKRIMSWGQSALPKAADSGSPNPLMGAAESLGGQDSGSALYDLMTSEGGTAYADGWGNLWYQSRVYLYNRQPKWTFGDNPANGETPYDPSSNFDYDNAFLYNQVQSVRQVSTTFQVTTKVNQGAYAQQYVNQGAQITEADQSSETEYGRRNSLQQTIFTTSDQDVQDRANWSLTKYKQPSLRLPQIILEPSSNPSVWPVALGVELGDVVKVIRRPLGAPSYTVTGVVQKIEHDISPGEWKTTLAISPLNIEQNVLLVGSSSYGTLAEGIAW
jgi:hypothetical protein